MSQCTSMDSLKNQLYMCRFRAVITATSDYETITDPVQRCDQALSHIHALFERHRIDLAKQKLRALTKDPGLSEEMLYFARGRVAYYDGAYTEAIQSFQNLVDTSESSLACFRGLLGLANSYYSLDDLQNAYKQLKTSEQLVAFMPDDHKISWQLTYASTLLQNPDKKTSVKELCYRALSLATQKNWLYFQIKAHYVLACLHEHYSAQEALMTTLELLKCYLDPEEAVHLAYLVNRKFQDAAFVINCGVVFDIDQKRICVQGQWLTLHDQPRLFSFMALLFHSQSFVSKAKVAESLWPEEAYKSRIHDPRVFDLARRTRELIEIYDAQPICLLSGRDGYRLVATGVQATAPLQHGGQLC